MICWVEMSKYYQNAYSLYLKDINGECGPVSNPSATCLSMCPPEELATRIQNTNGVEYISDASLP